MFPAPISYAIVDLSPELLRHQRQVLSGSPQSVEFFEQDVHELNLPFQFDLILANEVIADLAVEEVDPADSRHAAAAPAEAGAAVLAGVGIHALLARLWRHLLPGGAAVLTEYGRLGGGPAQAAHLNHPEFAVDFADALVEAAAIGFRAEVVELEDFLSVDPGAMLLTGQQEHILCLNHVLRKFGGRLDYAARDRGGFLDDIENVVGADNLSGPSFAHLSDGLHFGPELRQFKVLILRKPTAAE
jgi:SAM-dependent methyltransferase